MKNDVTVWTQQDGLENLIKRIRVNLIGPFIQNPRWKHLPTREQYEDIAKKLDALPRPLVLVDVQRTLKEGGMEKPWWEDDYLPVCDLCEEPRPWVLVIDRALYCEDQGEDEIDLHICSVCIDELHTQKMMYTIEAEMKGEG